nr:immunoglobulin heavy chain junction region [Mus musculus]
CTSYYSKRGYAMDYW